MALFVSWGGNNIMHALHRAHTENEIAIAYKD